MFAVLFNQNTWKLVHGCCFRSRSVAHPFGIAVLYWLQISGQAAIAPVAWLFVAFLDGGYYKCLRAAQFCHMDTAIQCQNETLYTASYIVIEKRAMRHEDHACQYAMNNSKAFFGTDKHSKSDWDTISALPSLSNPYMFPRERRHKSQISTEHWEYTALQKWTNQNVMVVTNLDGGPPPHEYKENGKRD
ncbi:CBN-CLHM-1 protein [Aphelenchoides avenae]|nr:CBN-CLHM-1 protein [Aphelenchus avenae]